MTLKISDDVSNGFIHYGKHVAMSEWYMHTSEAFSDQGMF